MQLLVVFLLSLGAAYLNMGATNGSRMHWETMPGPKHLHDLLKIRLVFQKVSKAHENSIHNFMEDMSSSGSLHPKKPSNTLKRQREGQMVQANGYFQCTERGSFKWVVSRWRYGVSWSQM